MVRGTREQKKGKRVKALALFSGGLDSALAAKVVMVQGVAVEAIYYSNAFLAGYKKDITGESCLEQVRIAKGIGIPLHIVDIAAEHLLVVRSPRYGYGGHLNPCIDCRIFMLQRAKAFMKKHGFSFLISGEVLGQRPMSQRRDTIAIIDRDSKCRGIVLRPLSAKHFKPTIAEEKGWVDRNALFAFSGRTRKPQLDLAKKLKIKEFTTPAGGCLLTDEAFVRKFESLSALIKVKVADIELLKLGRHFVCGKGIRIILGRNDVENSRLEELAHGEDILLRARDVAGPLGLVRTNVALKNGALDAASALIARYGKARDAQEVNIEYWKKNASRKKQIIIAPANENMVESLRLTNPSPKKARDKFAQ